VTADEPYEVSLAAVLKLERDGVAFFRRANAVAADPRVRQLFERLARSREESARLLEDAASKAGIHITPRGVANPYPFEAVAQVECYACGYLAEEIPSSCPQCGAARYSFEKEFTKATVWGTALSSGSAVAQAVEDAIPLAGGDLRIALEDLLRRERALLKEAEGELAAARP